MPDQSQLTFSPEALEALATSLAAKLEAHGRTVTRLADQQVADLEADRKYRDENTAFQKRVSDDLASLRRQRSDIPLAALILSIAAIVMSTIGLISTARASQLLTEEIRDIRHQLEVRDGKAAP